jgi:hypothetical protein
MKTFFIPLLAIGLFVTLTGCGDEESPLTTDITVSGTVTNNSGESGKIIVEIDYYLRDMANLKGEYAINVHRDFYVDSLYAWVDLNLDNKYNSGEPHGVYPTKFQVRNMNVTNLNFTIP